MFRALLAHPQEVMYKRNFGILRAYNVSWLWHGCSETATVPKSSDIGSVVRLRTVQNYTQRD
jgi:hypothetical protein